MLSIGGQIALLSGQRCDDFQASASALAGQANDQVDDDALDSSLLVTGIQQCYFAASNAASIARLALIGFIDNNLPPLDWLFFRCAQVASRSRHDNYY